jgi:hypothetical protein
MDFSFQDTVFGTIYNFIEGVAVSIFPKELNRMLEGGRRILCILLDLFRIGSCCEHP